MNEIIPIHTSILLFDYIFFLFSQPTILLSSTGSNNNNIIETTLQSDNRIHYKLEDILEKESDKKRNHVSNTTICIDNMFKNAVINVNTGKYLDINMFFILIII